MLGVLLRVQRVRRGELAPDSSGTGREVNMEERTTISTYENGPFLVTGGAFRVVDAGGGEFAVEKETIALCRCGASTKKPFCDGTHSKVGFRAAERAVEEGA
jgi:CDGSH-type Zn-finger protein